jgi:hypothetical protein
MFLNFVDDDEGTILIGGLLINNVLQSMTTSKHEKIMWVAKP